MHFLFMLLQALLTIWKEIRRILERESKKVKANRMVSNAYKWGLINKR